MTDFVKKLSRHVAAAFGSLAASVQSFAMPGDKAPVLPVGSAEILNVGGGLIIVVLAIIVLGVFYARTQGLRGGAKGIINVVASQALGPKERIAIIEVGDQQLLIGMTAASVQTLHVFDRPIEYTREVQVSFSDRLKTFMAGAGK